jgi:hypothetical protein
MLIGIDPDVSKSGVAIKQNRSIDLKTLSFFQLFDFFQTNREHISLVRIEASWLIKHNWNKKFNGTAAINAAIGNDAGRNHETGRKIVEMCQYLSIPFEEVRPLVKGWSGPDGKITHKELLRLTPLPARTNQEQRDACLLIL